MKKLYYLFLGIVAAIGCISCNDEWEDEQYAQLVSFKANVNDQGVTTTYVRYKPGGVVRYNLPLIVSGSTVSSKKLNVKLALDTDTLETLNEEVYGHREELYYKALDKEYYSMPETVEIPAGECVTTVPIDFKLNADLDQGDKWVLPLQIVDDPSLGYQANPRKHYRRAMLRLLPFNDYSGTYDAAQYKVYIAPDTSAPFTVSTTRGFVVDENTIFFYAGTRDIDHLDRKLYKIFVEFPADPEDKKLSLRTDNDNIKLTIPSDFQPYYSKIVERDQLKPYLEKTYITLYLKYSFVDYTTIPGQEIKYNVDGSLMLLRSLNTLIPDEDQQIQW